MIFLVCVLLGVHDRKLLCALLIFIETSPDMADAFVIQRNFVVTHDFENFFLILKNL